MNLIEGLPLGRALSTYGPMQLGASETSKYAKRYCPNESDVLLLSLRILVCIYFNYKLD